VNTANVAATYCIIMQVRANVCYFQEKNTKIAGEGALALPRFWPIQVAIYFPEADVSTISASIVLICNVRLFVNKLPIL